MRSRQLRPGRYSPFASSTERSLVERFAVLVPSTLLRATTTLPFVISTEAQRSGEICGPRSLYSAPGHDGPPLCHLDRSAAKWRDLRSSGSVLEMVFDRAVPSVLTQHAPSSNGEGEGCYREKTADLSTTLRPGRDDKGEGGTSGETRC